MPRYRSYWPRDDVIEVLADAGWQAVNLYDDPVVLPERTVALGRNIRFDRGGVRVRPGIMRLPVVVPGTDVLGVGVYRPIGGQDRLVLLQREGAAFVEGVSGAVRYVPFPGGEWLDGRAGWVQAGVDAGYQPMAWVLRGPERVVLRYDEEGGGFVVDTGFKRGWQATYVQNRIVVQSGRQRVSVSDLLDFGTWRALNEFDVLRGGDDEVVALVPWQNHVVLIGTRKAWYALGLDPALIDEDGTFARNQSFLRVVTREAGVARPGAALEAGGLIWFVGDRGLYAFEPRFDMELTVVGVPLSRHIQPIVDRVSWSAAESVGLAKLGTRVYVALPVSGEWLDVESATWVGQGVYRVNVPGLSVHRGDLVEVRGAVDGELNGLASVSQVYGVGDVLLYYEGHGHAYQWGDRADVRLVQRRPNRVLVYNLAHQAWESEDVLPEGFHADFVTVADGPDGRSLWLVDRSRGVMLYESGQMDEVLESGGLMNLSTGLEMPFALPAVLSNVNYGAAPVEGVFRTRQFTWGMEERTVRAAEVVCEVDDSAEVEVALRVHRAGRAPWETSRRELLTAGRTSVRVRANVPGLAADVECRLLNAQGTVVRGVLVETMRRGRTEE